MMEFTLGNINDHDQSHIDIEHKINEIIQRINKMEEDRRSIVKALDVLGLSRKTMNEMFKGEMK